MDIFGKMAMIVAAGLAAGACARQEFTMVTSTENEQWVKVAGFPEGAEGAETEIVVGLQDERQTMEGFGMCFSELSWRSLGRLSKEDYDSVMDELFAQEDDGARFTICRTPIGSSDFALKYYSYDDAPGDFSMAAFSVENDESTLIPLIKDALARNPELKIWASPWCPPQWMKRNGNYASKPLDVDGMKAVAERKRLELENVMTDNGCRMTLHEGEDSFILEERYLDAYALYFKKYVEAYRDRGIDIYMVMPQNEFNSDQNFPSCTWTVDGLKRFMHKLVPAMKEEGVQVFFGTVERPSVGMVDAIFEDPELGREVGGAAFQWAGRAIVGDVRAKYPGKTLIMSEQQCFNGANSWADFMAAWALLKDNIDKGVSIYDYWNMSLFDGEVSTWRWQQNSLISVDYETGRFHYNYEYYEMKHASRYIRPGAVCLGVSGSHDQALAFRNPDGSLVLLIAETEGRAENVTIKAGSRSVKVHIPASSLSTVVI